MIKGTIFASCDKSEAAFRLGREALRTVTNSLSIGFKDLFVHSRSML